MPRRIPSPEQIWAVPDRAFFSFGHVALVLRIFQSMVSSSDTSEYRGKLFFIQNYGLFKKAGKEIRKTRVHPWNITESGGIGVFQVYRFFHKEHKCAL